MLTLLLLLACQPEPKVETGSEPVPNDVDVLVVGSGSAGQSAVLSAREAGASVMLIEMSNRGGGSGWYAGNFFAAGTSWQEMLGIEDSPEAALAEWSTFAEGDPTDPMVENFVTASRETLEWLLDEAGMEVIGVVTELDSGSVARTHSVAGPELTTVLMGLVMDVLHTQHRADALLVQGGRVVGARVTNLALDEEMEIHAGAVVMATGGFARDAARLAIEQPILADHTTVPEAAPVVLGAGHPLLEEVGAGWQNQGHYGWYVHSTLDFRPGMEGEALLLMDLPMALVVDIEGQRVMNEADMAYGLSSIYTLLAVPDARLFALFDTPLFDTMSAEVPGYNWALEKEWVPAADLVAGGVARRYADVATLSATEGIDGATLGVSIDRYNDMVAQGADTDFGKSRDVLHGFGDGGFTVVEILPGAAKAFTGVALDTSARVLDATGQAIPGLYAAGEVAGMLGTAATGIGFSGSLTACHYTGRLAGQNAAAYVVGR